jgi:hypothetical protein
MEKKPYQKTEKWWLILVILFYLLYNLPGIPSYGNIRGALLHGVLTLVPLWISIYVGLYLTAKQRRFADVDHKQNSSNKEGIVDVK